MDRLIYITSGRGPAECCFVVSKVLGCFLKAVDKEKGKAEVLSQTPGPEKGTLFSVVVKVEGVTSLLLRQWEGTILWVCKSPYRKFHKRKNWYVGFYSIKRKVELPDEGGFVFQTLRSSGPGGQHVNKTESAVRAIHSASGLSVVVRDSRSQLQNKHLAIKRLKEKLQMCFLEQLTREKEAGWSVHNYLQRGNPIKVFEGMKFKLKP